MNTPRWLLFAILLLSFGFAPAGPVPTASSVSVPIAGTVSGLPESVVFSGKARITATPTSIRIAGAKRRMVVSVDLNGVSGRGLSSGTTYLATAVANLTRSFAASDVIEVTFPFFPGGSAAGAQARTAVATFTLEYDVSTGALTAANASVAAVKLQN
jgi:hypothetical protein